MARSSNQLCEEPVRVAIATRVDWGQLHRLLVLCFAYMDGRIDPPSSLTRTPPEALARKAQEETLIVARAGERLIGCAFLATRTDALYFGKVAVHPEFRGRDLLRRFIEEADDLARREGKTQIELQARVELVENHRTFARHGFEKWAETRHPGFDRTTSVTMRRLVPSTPEAPAPEAPAPGHNGGPPLEPPADSTRWAYVAWKAAQASAWTIPRETALRRLRQAEACGLTYREYMLELLNTGRHLQPSDTDAIAVIIARRE